jgi:cytochrome bd-type quinol oxidase subunit 2
VIAGLLFAVGCALAGSVAVLLRQRGAVAAPVVRASRPLASAIGLFRSAAGVAMFHRAGT